MLSSAMVSSFLLRSIKLYPVMCMMNLISALLSLLITFCFNVQISQSHKSDGMAKMQKLSIDTVFEPNLDS